MNNENVSTQWEEQLNILMDALMRTIRAAVMKTETHCLAFIFGIVYDLLWEEGHSWEELMIQVSRTGTERLHFLEHRLQYHEKRKWRKSKPKSFYQSIRQIGLPMGYFGRAS